MIKSGQGYLPQRVQPQWRSQGHCASPAQQMQPIPQASPPHAADEQQGVKIESCTVCKQSCSHWMPHRAEWSHNTRGLLTNCRK
jgi:hypothetical protein